MGEFLDDIGFMLRHYPFESLMVGVVCGGVGLFIGAAVMRWAQK